MSTEMEILAAVNGFYENAFGQLLQYTLAIVAFVGVVVPLVATLIQSRSLKAEKDGLEKHIEKEINEAKERIREELLEEIKDKIKDEESLLISRMDDRFKKLDERLEQAKAGSFHIQGNSHRKASQFALAAIDFCYATVGYIRGKDEMNAQRTLNMLIDDCLPQVTKSLYESLSVETRIDEVSKLLEEVNENSRYTDRIKKLSAESKKAKSRESPAETKK